MRLPRPPQTAPKQPRQRLMTITARAVLITCSVALVAVLVTAAVAFPLTRSAAQREARAALAAQADLVAALLSPRAGVLQEQRVARRLHARRIDIALVRDGGSGQAWVPARVIEAVSAGEPVHTTVRRDGRPIMVEARPISDGSGVVLAQPTAAAEGGAMIRFGLALLAGLLAGLVAGVLLARRLSRPIRHAATAARRLSAGDRTVRLDIEPPAEVADLSRALNELNVALATSEGRQRDFLLSVSHELRTPLTTIRGYAEALADGVVDSETAPRAGRTVLAEADRLDRLVADLLALARLEAQDFRLELIAVDLPGLVRSAGEAWAPRCAEAELRLAMELPNYPLVVRTDPTRLRQVVDGLLENALRVVPSGAPLVLAVRSAPGVAVLEVRDGGPGLSQADLAVAFERGALYERYRGIRKVGTGLGLALAARLVQRLGGWIEAGHAPEGGARFTVRLPTA